VIDEIGKMRGRREEEKNGGERGGSAKIEEREMVVWDQMWQGVCDPRCGRRTINVHVTNCIT
jgi:hypothetical protein